MVEAPAKARSDIEILVEKIDCLIDERIRDLWYTAGTPSFSDAYRTVCHGRIDELESMKRNIKRLAEELIKAD